MSSSAANAASVVWQAEVDRLVRESLTAATFADLLEELPSIDPLTVWQSLHRQFARDERAGGLMLPTSVDQTRSPLPIAHPLSFDWRYSERTNDDLVNRLSVATESGDAIGYFGAPTTWRAARQNLPDRRHVLFDRDAARHAEPGAEAYVIAIGRETLPVIPLRAAVVDPPWYPEYHDAFLAAAATIVAVGGVVYASFPPPLTRPGVLAERVNIVQDAVRAGLVVEDVFPLALRYETPPFEAAAFAAAGLKFVPQAWRRGDLLTFRRLGACATSASALPDEGWQFVTIDQIPLAVRATVTGGEELFAPAISGATLPTVSRRHPARADAALWSSRNRIYGSREPALLTAVVLSLDEGVTDPIAGAVGAEEQEKVIALANEVRDLVRIERKEHGLD
jgi:hypothetical protein